MISHSLKESLPRNIQSQVCRHTICFPFKFEKNDIFIFPDRCVKAVKQELNKGAIEPWGLEPSAGDWTESEPCSPEACYSAFSTQAEGSRPHSCHPWLSCEPGKSGTSLRPCLHTHKDHNMVSSQQHQHGCQTQRRVAPPFTSFGLVRLSMPAWPDRSKPLASHTGPHRMSSLWSSKKGHSTDTATNA